VRGCGRRHALHVLSLILQTEGAPHGREGWLLQ
jgi:hypothetical protein